MEREVSGERHPVKLQVSTGANQRGSRRLRFPSGRSLVFYRLDRPERPERPERGKLTYVVPKLPRAPLLTGGAILPAFGSNDGTFFPVFSGPTGSLSGTV